MKSYVLVSSALCASLVLGACSNTSKKPYTVIDVTMDELDTLLEEKKTFPLLVEREGCAFCAAMNSYIDQTKNEHDNITVYHLNTTEFKLFRKEEGAKTLVSDTEDGKRLLELFPYFLYTPAIYRIEDGKPVDGAFGYDETRHTVSLWNLDSTIDWDGAQNIPVWDYLEECQPKAQ